MATGKELSVRISAEDGASKVFAQLAQNAKTLADMLDQAGKEGASSFKEVDKGAESASKSLTKLDSTGTGVIRTFGEMERAADSFASGLVKTGSGLDTLGRTLDTLGQQYIDQERQMSVLNRMYGDQAERIIDASDALQDYSIFSDDAARQSMVFLNTLNQNYGLSIDNLEALLVRAADVASAHGKTLEDVTQMFQNAIRGEGEYAEAVGITLNDNYVAAEAARRGIEGWTTSMTDAEKAAFRFQLIMEQTSSLDGFGGEYANTAAGRVRQLGNELQDAAQQAGAFIGPWGQIIGATGGGLATLGQAAEGVREVVAGLKLLKTLAGTTVGSFGLLGAAAGVASYGLVKMIGGIRDLESASKALDRLDIELEVKGDFDKQSLLKDVRESFADVTDWLEDANGPFALNTGASNALKAQIGQVFAEAFSDPAVDSEAFASWFIGKVEGFKASGDQLGLSRFLADINTNSLDQFRGSVDAATDSVANLGTVAKATAADVKSIFADLPSTLDDLRIDGQGKLASDIDSLHTGILDALTPTRQEAAQASGRWLDVLPGEDQALLLDGLASKTDLSTESAAKLDTAWGRIVDKMSTGNLDNAKVMTDVFAVLNDTSLDADQKVAEIERISNSMAQYIDQYAQLKDAQVDWLANGDNFLNWWQEYDKALRNNQRVMVDASTDMAALNAQMDQQRQFRLDVEIADGVQEASQALDQVLRTFGEIDALGQRSASAGSIADTLIGTPGETGDLQDLWERIAAGTSDAVLAQEDYNNAINAGIAIQESNVRVQDDLNVVRAKQMPLLQQEQEAYAANIDRIAHLNAVEARRVLLLQDTAVQSQVAALYSQAYAAAIGEVPKDVTTKMILEAAEADAGLKDLLLNLGLIQQNSDGTISVNFPDAESVGASIDRVTLALLHMQAVSEGKSVYEVAVELYGEDEANRLLGIVQNADGKRSTMTFTVVSDGLDEAGNHIQTILLADGTQITVIANVDGLDDLTQAGSDLKAVTLADGTVVTVKTDVDTTGWENSTVGDIIANGKSVEVETVLKPPTGWTVEGWNGSEGPLPNVALEGEITAITNVPEYTGEPVKVQGEVVFSGPTASQGDGTGGPLAGLNSAQQQFVVEAVVHGRDDVDGLSSAISEMPSDKQVVISGDASDALQAIGSVNSAASVMTTRKSVTVDGDASGALGEIGAVNDAMSALPSSRTIAINVVTTYSTIGSPSGGGSGGGRRHGGIPAYASGGVLFRGGEAGPELAHFASGGTALLPRDDLYIAPAGTVIEPANSAATKLTPGYGLRGGPLVHIENITIGAGADPGSANAIVQEIVARLDRALEHRDRSGGLIA